MTRLEALERVAEAAAELFSAPIPPGKHTTTGGVVFVDMMAFAQLRAALDAIPAQAAEPQGETVELGVVRARLSGRYSAVQEPDQEDPRDWVHVCNVRFVVPPLPRVPEVVGEVVMVEKENGA